jgi:hypothetical protein
VCFSPEASFTVGGVLVPGGVFCVRAAWAKNPRMLPIALMPLAFAAQQIAEGFVWLGLQDGDLTRVRGAALVFLFFALAFWPWWLSVAMAVLEAHPRRRQLLIGSAALTTAWFWVLYYPLLVGPDSLLSVRVVHHSILYSYSDLAVYRYIPQSVLRALYLLSVVMPMVLGPRVFGWLPSVLLFSSVIIAAAAFEYAFISVWCFFAAALTGSLCVLLYRLPAAEPTCAQA